MMLKNNNILNKDIAIIGFCCFTLGVCLGEIITNKFSNTHRIDQDTIDAINNSGRPVIIKTKSDWFTSTIEVEFK